VATYTDGQRAKLKIGRRPNSPHFYSASLGAETPISRETEDALILALSEAKSKAVAYLKLILDAKAGSTPYSDLLTEFADKQVENATAQKDEVDVILKKFNDFKDGLTRGSQDTPGAEGFSDMLTAMNKGLGRLGARSRAATYEQQFIASAKAEFSTALTDPEKRELRSWIRVLVLYP
jgi:hypothetical protein